MLGAQASAMMEVRSFFPWELPLLMSVPQAFSMHDELFAGVTPPDR